MAYGVDISHFTYDYSNGAPITPHQFELHYNRGVRRYIVSIADQFKARQQIENIVNNAPWAEIQTYRYYYFSYIMPAAREDEMFIAEVRQNLYNIQFHWLDIEDTTVSQPLEAKIFDIDELIHFWEFKCYTGIYTSYSMWTNIMQNYHGFNYMPLWFALWNWTEDLNNLTGLDPAQGYPTTYGGWGRGTMKQTQGDFLLDGVWCDTNYYEEVIPPPEPPIIIPPPEPKYDVQVVYSEGQDNKSVTVVLPAQAEVESIGFDAK